MKNLYFLCAPSPLMCQLWLFWVVFFLVLQKMTKLGFGRKSVSVQMFKQKFRIVGLITEKCYLHIWIQESKCNQKMKLGVFRIKLYVLLLWPGTPYWASWDSNKFIILIQIKNLLTIIFNTYSFKTAAYWFNIWHRFELLTNKSLRF